MSDIVDFCSVQFREKWVILVNIFQIYDIIKSWMVSEEDFNIIFDKKFFMLGKKNIQTAFQLLIDIRTHVRFELQGNN